MRLAHTFFMTFVILIGLGLLSGNQRFQAPLERTAQLLSRGVQAIQHFTHIASGTDAPEVVSPDAVRHDPIDTSSTPLEIELPSDISAPPAQMELPESRQAEATSDESLTGLTAEDEEVIPQGDRSATQSSTEDILQAKIPEHVVQGLPESPQDSSATPHQTVQPEKQYSAEEISRFQSSAEFAGRGALQHLANVKNRLE